MKKLTEKLEDIYNDNHIDDVFEKQAQEVKDIAIAFARKIDGLVMNTEPEIWEVNTGDDEYATTPEEFFEKFISNYYK